MQEFQEIFFRKKRNTHRNTQDKHTKRIENLLICKKEEKSAERLLPPQRQLVFNGRAQRAIKFRRTVEAAIVISDGRRFKITDNSSFSSLSADAFYGTNRFYIFKFCYDALDD